MSFHATWIEIGVAFLVTIHRRSDVAEAFCERSDVSRVRKATNRSLNFHSKRKKSHVEEHGDELAALVKQGNLIVALVLMVGLGLHSVLEGLALGEAPDQRALTSIGLFCVCSVRLLMSACVQPLLCFVINIWKPLRLGHHFVERE